MQKVTIIGAGISGLTAALRLAERGYQVTIYDRDRFVGGKFRATEWLAKDGKRSVFHEHSYHLFLNWYHNFWRIAREVGAAGKFIPMSNVKFLRKGEFPRMRELRSFGSLMSIYHNLFSGVIPAADMFLYIYSMLDLLGTPMGQERYRDLISVNAFASTKPYATEASAGMYDEYLAKTFAVASYQSSAKTFQTFLECGTYCPDPLYWSLEGDSYNCFFRPLCTKLEELGVQIVLCREARRIELDSDVNVCRVQFRNLADGRDSNEWRAVDGPLIVAIPHAALFDLLSPDLLNRDETLRDGSKLHGVPMASVHLHLNRKFTLRLHELGARLPREPVILLGSKFKLSFVDNSKLWPGLDHTYLNIVASDSRPLEKIEAPSRYTTARGSGQDGPKLAIDKPTTAVDYILNEVRRFLPFEPNEIDLKLLEIDRNVGRELFINEVGSWKWRPSARTNVRNLFLAGDFCKTFIDVVCLEGAVVSGLQAAECVRRACGLGSPIRIEQPKRYPYSFFWPLKLALAPYAAGAKAWSMLSDLVGGRNG